MTMTWLLFQVKVEGRTQFLSAVCMSCLEGSGGQPVRCRCCTQPWDGSSLVLGTMYSYDIFAAMPCCTERLKVSCSFGVFVIRNDVFLKSTTFWKRWRLTYFTCIDYGGRCYRRSENINYFICSCREKLKFIFLRVPIFDSPTNEYSGHHRVKYRIFKYVIWLSSFSHRYSICQWTGTQPINTSAHKSIHDLLT